MKILWLCSVCLGLIFPRYRGILEMPRKGRPWQLQTAAGGPGFERRAEPWWGVDGVPEHITDSSRTPHTTPEMFDSMLVEVADNIPQRMGRVGIQRIHQADLFRLFRDRHLHRRLHTVEKRFFFGKAVRNPSAHIKSAFATGIVSIGHTFLNGFAFELCKHNTDIQHRPANRGRRIKTLG